MQYPPLRDNLIEPEFLARFGFLYEEYTENCYAYESVIMLRSAHQDHPGWPTVTVLCFTVP